MRRVAITCLCALLLAAGCTSRKAGYVASTSRYVFGYDEEGNVVWKRPMPGMRALAAFDSLYLACAGVDTVLVVCGDLHTGEERWRYADSGKLLLGSADRDSAGRPIFYITVSRPGKLTYMHLDATTGKVLKSWTRPSEPLKNKRPPGWVCPAEPVEEVNIVNSSTHAFGFNRDAKRLWELPLRAGEIARPFGNRFAIIQGRSSFRVLDRRTGQVLWGKELAQEIRSLVGDDEHLQVQLADGSFRLYQTPTGRPFRRTGGTQKEAQELF